MAPPHQQWVRPMLVHFRQGRSRPRNRAPRNTFGEKPESDVIYTADEFSEPSAFQGARLPHLTPGKTSLRVIESVPSKSKPIATADAIVKHVRCLINFYVELRHEANVALTGLRSAIL